MHVCNTALRDSTPLVAHKPPPPQVLSDLRRSARRAWLYGAGDLDPVTKVVARLPGALGRRLVFFEPNSSEMSFDEAWLLNLFDAVRNADHDRYCFAMLSRMSRTQAAELHFHICKAVGTLRI